MSEREARALRQIEQQLAGDDPGLAARLSQALPVQPSLWPQKFQNPLITVVLLAAVVCLAVGATVETITENDDTSLGGREDAEQHLQ